MATAEEKLKKWVDFFTEAGIKDPNKIDTFAKKFSSEEIDDDVIQNLTDKDLEDLGVKAKGDRLRIIKCIQGKNEIELAVDLATSSPLKNNTTESPPKNNTTESPPKNNTTESTPKKRSKKDMFLEAIKGREHNVVAIVGEASSIITHLEDQNNLVQRRLALIEWPNKSRNAISDLEGKFNLKKVKVCCQCSLVHFPFCLPDPNTTMYPVEANEQRIFKRRQRWLWLLIENASNLEVQKIVIKLTLIYDTIKRKPVNSLNESEQVIHALPDFHTLLYYFCDCLARVYEESSNILKANTGLKNEIEELSFFEPPADIFMTVLINMNSIFREDGKVKYKSQAIQDVSKFIPGVNKE